MVRTVSPGSPAGGGTAPPVAEVYPITGATDLLGRMPVRVRAEDGHLVGYGFEKQRVSIPAGEIGAVYTHRGWGKQWGRTGPALVVLDKEGRVRLRAPGLWSGVGRRNTRSSRTYSYTISDGLADVCASLGLDRPKYLTFREVRRQKALWRKAPGYRKLRIWSRGYLFTRLALVMFGLVAGGLGIAAGVALANLLPQGFGDIRALVGIVLCTAAVWGALWLSFFALRALNWLAVSLNVGTLAPPGRFFGAVYRPRNRKAETWLTMLMAAAIPILFVFGPIIGLVSLTHGFSDQALVASLRQHGASALGFVIDVPTYSTDKDGNTVVTDHPTLEFLPMGDADVVRTPDPAIAGWTWPMDPTSLVTIVYDPANPSTAAVAGQISGSPWHGAPTGNVISGALLTVVLVPLTWTTVRRIRNLRRESREGLFEGLA